MKEGRFTTEETEVIGRIEALRASLSQSTEVVPYVDYGAGSAGDRRSGKEAGDGVAKTVIVGERCRSASQPAVWAKLLFAIVRAMPPSNGLELGTFLGISGAYQASGQMLNGYGRFTTLEGSEAFASIARRNFDSLGLHDIRVVTGRFRDTLPTALDDRQEFDHVFIDGHHDEQATIEYWRMIAPHLAPVSIAVFDDVDWSDGMARAWRAVAESPDVVTAVDAGKFGIMVVRRG